MRNPRLLRRATHTVGALLLAATWACNPELPAGDAVEFAAVDPNFLNNGAVIAGADGGDFVGAITANNSGRGATEFWDNPSSDGAACNIGFFAAGTLLNGGCANTWTGSDANKGGGYTTYWGDASGNRDASSFMFDGNNTYSVKLVAAYSGASPGETDIGWFTVSAGGAYTFHPVADWGNKVLNVPTVIATGGMRWGIYIKGGYTPAGGCGGDNLANCSDAIGGIVNGASGKQNLFTLMSNTAQNKFLVGMEDVSVVSIPGPPGPDADYNDFILQIDAVIAPPPPPQKVALFVIGDVEPHGIGKTVNFWGAQWWKNNDMSGLVSNGVASFKGYADLSDNTCGGVWSSRPGNSSNPPSVIPADVAIIVTSKVLKVGPNISGDIKQIVMVHHDGGYGPNPGHRGNGPVTSIVCTAP